MRTRGDDVYRGQEHGNQQLLVASLAVGAMYIPQLNLSNAEHASSHVQLICTTLGFLA